MNIIKLQVMFEWSLEWDCRGQISLPTGMGGKLKTPLSCTVHAGLGWVEILYPGTQTLLPVGTEYPLPDYFGHIHS